MVDVLRKGEDYDTCGKRDWSKGVIVGRNNKQVKVYYLGGDNSNKFK